MRKLSARWGAWSADGLRMRFRPRSRVGQSFLQIVPWINFAVVLLLFLALAKQTTLQPGIVFELPRADFREGLHQGAQIVMISAQRAQGVETLIFFDDVRYQLGDAEKIEALRAELMRSARRPDGRQLLLLADRRVPHGDVMQLVNLARSAGIHRVNVAIKPD